jgi:hypothetical protein
MTMKIKQLQDLREAVFPGLSFLRLLKPKYLGSSRNVPT